MAEPIKPTEASPPEPASQSSRPSAERRLVQCQIVQPFIKGCRWGEVGGYLLVF